MAGGLFTTLPDSYNVNNRCVCLALCQVTIYMALLISEHAIFAGGFVWQPPESIIAGTLITFISWAGDWHLIHIIIFVSLAHIWTPFITLRRPPLQVFYILTGILSLNF